MKKASFDTSLGKVAIYANSEAMAVGEASMNLEPFTLGRDQPLWLSLPGFPGEAKVSGYGWPAGSARPSRLAHADRAGWAVRDTAEESDTAGWHVELAVTQVRDVPGITDSITDGSPGWSRESTASSVAGFLGLPGVADALRSYAGELAGLMVSPKGVSLRKAAASTALDKARHREHGLRERLEAAEAESREEEQRLLGILDA